MEKINILIGTKGQLIKMAPIIKLLEKQNIEYNFINAAQHGDIFLEIADSFKLSNQSLNLINRKKDVLNTYEEFIWLQRALLKTIIKEKKIFKNSLIVVHGDAPPVFLGWLVNKFIKSKIAHVEAGLRSFDFFNPFPEEIFRYLIDKKAEYLYAPNKIACVNLKKMNAKGEIINTIENTVLDTIRFSIKDLDYKINKSIKNSVIFTVHRYETLKSRKKMLFILDILRKISSNHKVTFVMHNTTKNYLEKNNLINKIPNNVNIIPLQIYPKFIKMIHNCKFVVTDGGGLQEETTYLGKPCLILRTLTERSQGLSENIVISKFNKEKIEYFIKNYSSYKRKSLINNDVKPSQIIVDHLKEYVI